MSKASKTTTKAAKTATPAKAAKTASAPRVVRSQAATAAATQKAPETALYQVLEPFWLNNATVKPTHDGAPVWIEMTEAEAAPYQEAGVLGTEPGEVPTTNTDASEPNGGQDATNAGGAQDGA